MGIPKLRQDLLPYAEEITLGHLIGKPPILTLPVVRKVVIDGPSLVYYVYHRLYPRSDSIVSGVDAQPSYIEICRGVVQFLTTLAIRQVDIEAIYFDGALPQEKQAVRLERLERARSQLEHYRKQWPGPFEPSAAKNLNAEAPGSENLIWKRELPVPESKQQLPQPPFMVACVLDNLQHDPTNRYPVQVVPGEADPYCAAIARNTGAGILSNDSDMVMYDLGPEGSLVLLDTLDLTWNGDIEHDEELQSPIITAQRLYPINIARRMGKNMPSGSFSLLRFGFERSRDPSAHSGEIRSRCTSKHDTELGVVFERFCESYKGLKRIGIAREIANILVQLDPRLSELYCQFQYPEYADQLPQGPHVYLPLLIEDPSRDSSWSYGKFFRILAYSLLKLAAESMKGAKTHDYVIEFQRRGPRIIGVPLKLLDKVELLSSLEAAVRRLKKNMLAVDVSPKWLLFGLEEVNEEKTRAGKRTVSRAWTTEFLHSGYVGCNLSWEDIHVYENVKAVLYSLWILKQACAVSNPAEQLRISADNLSESLRSLGSLRSLMASRWEIASSSQDISGKAITEAFDRADSQWATLNQTPIDENAGKGSEFRTGYPTSKATRNARNRWFRTNDNIFELLNPP